MVKNDDELVLGIAELDDDAERTHSKGKAGLVPCMVGGGAPSRRTEEASYHHSRRTRPPNDAKINPRSRPAACDDAMDSAARRSEMPCRFVIVIVIVIYDIIEIEERGVVRASTSRYHY